jgi:transposase
MANVSKKGNGKAERKRHSEEYKREALALADQVGVAVAAEQLGLHDSQLYGWRNKQRLEQGRSEQDRQLAEENARLKRQLAEQAEELAILKKAAAYFAKNQR